MGVNGGVCNIGNRFSRTLEPQYDRIFDNSTYNQIMGLNACNNKVLAQRKTKKYKKYHSLHNHAKLNWNVTKFNSS